MLITLLKSKIHRCRVTATDLDYEGSCAIDPNLMKQANIVPYEQIHIYNVNNGERFTTYAIEGAVGEIGIRGSAARKAVVGDTIIICAYANMTNIEASEYTPVCVFVNEIN